uniref:Endonuclease, Uma2 family (Restriction endonuclease fold) n=1 Tax=Candidatus Kentrum sp. TUN TaxID=2126343 RepID=A0A450ZPS7_9GAMM|nr:MAG: Endonuclease, Uma2 family (restriction endonuclease fold) [Candidatus Kentron sp. TUN]VFK53889.1 MAG: Endonuclease, Uma2 family (restriction endonuclease fold) [Candidatus Kentron sp. TUN]VFK55718.1 MAG: Endonuclease, Uma2 family (restriction endonuclease fold) [Candidatus Kentron sp. TUN]
MATRLAERMRHSFNIANWYAMARTGVLADDYRGELIEGEIIDMPPIGSEHGGCVDWLHYYFSRQLGDRAIVRVQNPIPLGDFSEPQPDMVIARACDDFYRSAHPTPADVLLVIEVADTSLVYDRTVKGPLYARYGIPEYWLVNLTDHCLERYLTPTRTNYAHSSRHVPGEKVSPGFAAQSGRSNLAVPVSGILGC